VDNSSLTGESALLKREPESAEKNPMEAKNLAFFGTWVKVGMGYGVSDFSH
jgi:magnesium-transporting ATPase (P-type)